MYIIYADTYTYYTFVYISTCMSSVSSVFFVLAGEIWQPSKAPLCLYLNKCCTTSSVWYKNLSVWGQNSWGTWSRASCPKAFFWHPEDTVPRTVFFATFETKNGNNWNGWHSRQLQFVKKLHSFPKEHLGSDPQTTKTKHLGSWMNFFYNRWAKCWGISLESNLATSRWLQRRLVGKQLFRVGSMSLVRLQNRCP